MTQHFWDLSVSLLAYLLMAIAFLGWGRVAARLIGIGMKQRDRALGQIWLGWATGLLIFQSWHVAFPLSFLPSVLFFGMGGMLAWHSLKRTILGASGKVLQARMGFAAAMLIVASWLACRAMQSPANYDSGLYHFNSIRWLNEYPVVPGLGNLHGRLAFNQSYFVYPAALNLYPFFNHGHNLANSFLLFLIWAECLCYAWRHARNWWGGPIPLKLCDWLPVLLFPAVALYTATTCISSPSPDTAAFVLQLILYFHLARILQAEGPTRRCVFETRFILVVAGASVTVKLSCLAFALLTAGIALAVCIHRCTWSATTAVKQASVSLAVGLLFLLVWMGRGVVLSGCPIYPSTVMYSHTDWAVPLEKVRDEARWIQSWARLPGWHWSQVLGSWDWLEPWLAAVTKGQKTKMLYPLGISAVASILSLVFLLVAPRTLKGTSGPQFLGLLAPVGGLVFWFFAAPDPRLAGSLFWILCAACAAPLLANLERFRPLAKRGLYTAAFLLVNLSVISWFLKNPGALRAISLQGYQPIPQAELVVKTTRSNLAVYVPATGDQCWDSPLPSTPDFDPALELRSSEIRCGFSSGQ